MTARVCVLLTSFNRRAQTLACLERVGASRGLEDVALEAVLVDDASPDGTAAAVRETFPWVQVIESEGDLFWCRGMHRAFAWALGQRHDFYLWLNDDTLPDHDALARLLACHAALAAHGARPLIVVGSTRSAHDGHVTYGGEQRLSRRRLRFGLVQPGAEPRPVDTFNGNMVLIDAAAAALAGNLDPGFEHAMGDTDYGLRATRAGVACWLAPGTHGTCENNPLAGTYRDRALPWARRWALMLGRKGLPPRSWWRLTRRHGGALWPALLAWPYARLYLARWWPRLA